MISKYQRGVINVSFFLFNLDLSIISIQQRYIRLLFEQNEGIGEIMISFFPVLPAFYHCTIIGV